MNHNPFIKTKTVIITAVAFVLVLNFFLLFAFQINRTSMHPVIHYDNYEKFWKEVDTLESQGLTKSALEKTEAIYILAKKSDNAPQVIKSLIYKVKYKQVLEEGGFEKTLSEFETEINGSHFPAKNILSSAAAELYWSYYEQNRWRFAQRTQTINFKQDDISTWDLKKITQHVTELYNASLQNTDSLKQTSIESFAAILEKGNMPVNFRPTLYDLLAHRALDFFMNDEATITQPAYKFNITGTDVFQSSEKFVQLHPEAKDSTSGKFLALTILQNLLQFHLKDSAPDALVDVELKRFQFLKNNSVNDLKDSLYLSGLLELEKKFEKDSAGATVSVAIAQFYNERANDYQPPLLTVHQWDKKTALAYCDKVIGKFPTTSSAVNAKVIRAVILAKNISLTVEKVNIPDQPFRGLIEYRNVNHLYFRLIKNSDALEDKISRLEPDKQYAIYLNETVVQQWSQSLPDPGDYQQHAAEIKIPALPFGEYIIIGSASENFSIGEAGLFKATTFISNISYISKRNKTSYSFYVLDRETGKPLAGTQASILSQQYDNANRNYYFKETGRYTSDANGYFEIPSSTTNQNFRVEFSNGKDELLADDYFYPYRNDAPTQKTIRTIFFTDRAIYRPGQTIYFKGIMVQSDGDANELLTKFNTVAEFFDVNGQKIQSLNLTTNDYGSFNGSFTAPANGLNGEMMIRNTFGFATISVEEYKRPRFEVVFDTIKGSFRLNDQVRVKATARSYAGANIDGATVTYRIVRQAKFPVWYWGMKRGGYNQFTQDMEIGNGTTTTDVNGSFEISFPAIPDLKIPKTEKPNFDYRVYADVIDLTGETHTSETFITVGYVSLEADIKIPDNISKDSLNSFAITTENLNNIFEPAQGTITIYSLQQPDRIFRDRLWKRPDQFVMTKEEFYKSFPNDVYDNEDDFTNWTKKSKVSEQSFNTATAKTVSFSSLSKAPQGKYLLELTTKDKFGEEVKVQKYFSLYDEKNKEVPVLQSLWNSGVPEKAEAGTTVQFQLGTSEKEMNAIYEIGTRNFTDRKLLNWKKGKQNLSIPITENFKGGMTITIVAVRHGRIYRADETISVPYTDKELKLEFETFRNKLLPGQKEEWKLKISGSKGEPVAAEMVAAMYDASLDAFRANNWLFDIQNLFNPYSSWDQGNCFSVSNSDLFAPSWFDFPASRSPVYDLLNWFGFSFAVRYYARGEMMQADAVYKPAAMENDDNGNYKKLGANDAMADSVSIQKAPPTKNEELSVRKNLQETAFFFPQLQTDEGGNVILKFTIPEALTRWKFLGFAHTKDLKYGMISKETVTQKDLMVTPNAPRFFREGDKVFFAAKVTNLSDHDISGTSTLQLANATTMKPVDGLFANSNNVKSFTAKKGESTSLLWELIIPEGMDAIDYKVMARAGNQSDGEENVLPVLSNKTLVTETLPLNVRGTSTKNYSITKLLQSGSSTSLKNYNLTLEFTSNPAWYAVQALPYLMDYPYQCSEQTFNRFYSNALATNIANSNPKIKQVFDQWRNLNTDALLSNLEKNQELKSLLLQETPWVMQAQDESERKKRIALLFDLNRMSNEMDAALNRLQQLQMANGGWSWFAGGPDDRYITQYIITGIGHLSHLNVSFVKDKTNEMTGRAIPYLDDRMREDYENLMKYKAKLEDNQLSYTAVQYLYARSYFMDAPVSDINKKAYDYYKSQAQKYWTKQTIYAQGMIALALQRYGDKKTAAAIIKSLKENSITNEELGMYWKSNGGGYYWYQAPVETQALLIEAFDEVTNDQVSVDNMKLWLLKQKQTNDWKTTKATAEAVYALLLHGGTWLMNEPAITVTLGNTVVDLSRQSSEAGTGYFKTSWKGNDVAPEMGNIKVTRNSSDPGVSWGAVYWQYFEQLDKITPSATPLSLQKKLFIQRNSETGPVMEPITATTQLKPGDLVKVRIELRVDRDMEYVHMKDLRAACFEPLNVLSEYKWQDGLGYYEETKDASTNFFFDHLRKGTYVFEYPLRAQLKGDFSNGIATIQCMYAPEFTSHSEGIRLSVK